MSKSESFRGEKCQANNECKMSTKKDILNWNDSLSVINKYFLPVQITTPNCDYEMKMFV